jgi:primary-amine oxidase
MGPDNPYGNAFTWTTTPIQRESEAARMANTATARVWEVTSAERRNAVGKKTAYHLIPQPSATLLAQPGSTVHGRATFATKHLWATRFDPAERFPAGDYPNAHAGGAGLPAWTAADRSLVDEDIVLWHVFGPTHIPRPEDWPIMPVDYSGFLFKPYGFLDRNPALDLPDGAAATSCCGGGADCTCGH